MGEQRQRQDPLRDLDPAVASVLTDANKRKKQQGMSPEERAEAKRQAERSMATYDIPRGVKETVTATAEQEGLTASAVAAALIADGLRRYQEGRISLDGAKRKSVSYRWEYVIDDDQILAVLNGRSSLEKE
jgi:hypothetical protein